MAPNAVAEAVGSLVRTASGSKRRPHPDSPSQQPSKGAAEGGREGGRAAASGAGDGISPGRGGAGAGAGGLQQWLRKKDSSSSSLLSSTGTASTTLTATATTSSGASSIVGALSPVRRHQQRVALATAAELAVPPIAWPTLGVFALGYALYLLPPWLTWQSPSWKTIPVQAYAVFLLFTPLHDAVHRAVSTREHRWVNEAVGWLAALAFLAPFPGFRFIHLQHHKHTNVPGRDPDMWSSGGPWHASVPAWGLPFFWTTQQLFYYLWYLDKMPMRPLPEAFSVALCICSLTVGIVWCLVHGYGLHFLYFALLPFLVAGTGLAYSFDYAPHRPHHVDRFESIYGCTSVLGGVLDPHEGAEYLTGVLMGQNHHNIHHLYPQIPFYRYKQLWEAHEEELLALGTPVTNWLGPLRVK